MSLVVILFCHTPTLSEDVVEKIIQQISFTGSKYVSELHVFLNYESFNLVPFHQ